MKKACILALILMLCFIATACELNHNQGSVNATRPTVDPSRDPEIVIAENGVEREDLYNTKGKHIGYIQWTEGTNCGNEGIVLCEYLDLDNNVLNSYAPKFAGGTLASGRFGSDYIIWESDYNQNGATAISYFITPDSIGEIYAYQESVAGCTTRLDIYGADRQVIRSLVPRNPKNQLSAKREFSSEELVENYYSISEFGEDSISYTSYYDENGKLLGDFRKEHVASEVTSQKCVRIEARDESGNKAKVFEASENSHIEIYYDSFKRAFIFYEEFDFNLVDDHYMIRKELYALETYEFYFGEYWIRDNEEYSHTEIKSQGYTIQLTEDPERDVFIKADVYDAQGTLKATVEPRNTDRYLEIIWDQFKKCCEIRDYSADGLTHYSFSLLSVISKS